MKFDTNCRRLKKWLDKNQSYPKLNENPDLYRFVSYTRLKANKGKLSKYELKLLVAMKFEFQGQDMVWYSRFNELKEFIELNRGRYPRMTMRKKIKEYDQLNGVWLNEKREQEYYLGKWVQGQRLAIKNANIRSDRKSLLESINFQMDGYKCSAVTLHFVSNNHLQQSNTNYQINSTH